MLIQLLLFGIVFGANNLAAALALGALGQAAKRWRIVLIFGLFEFFIPLLGLWLGSHASQYIASVTEWLGPLLMALMGAWTLLGELRGRQQEEKLAQKVTTWGGLLMLATGLSLDNLIVGFSLGLGGRSPLLLASAICVCSVSFTLLGLWIGKTARHHWETAAEWLAGILLLALAWATWQGWL